MTGLDFVMETDCVFLWGTLSLCTSRRRMGKSVYS